MTGAEALAHYRAQQKADQQTRDQQAIRRALTAVDDETRRVLTYVGRELQRDRDPSDHAMLRQVLQERLNRIGR